MERLTKRSELHPNEIGTTNMVGALAKLADWEDAEDKGLLLKPKCKPGDYVYEANFERNIVSEYEVSSIRYGINNTFRYIWVLRKGIYSNLDSFRDDDIGKTVFLTKAEAEQKLREMEGGNNVWRTVRG